MRLISCIMACLFALTSFAHEYEATNFLCEGNGRSLFLKVNKDTKQTEFFTYMSMGPQVWLAHSLRVDERHFMVELFRPESAASGVHEGGTMLTSLTFNLPLAKVVRYQSGGYYIPEWKVVPAQFFLQVTEQDSSDKTNSVSLSCVGN